MRHVAVCLLALGCLADRAACAHAPVAGEAAPTFVGYGTDFKKVSLESYRGKVVVVSFWATWCPPCRQELPILANIQKAGQGQIQVIAINTESRDVFRQAAKLLKDYPIRLTNDEDRRSFEAYGAKGLPHLVVIGKDLKIVSVREGYGPDELDGVAAELTAALRAGRAEEAAPGTDAPQSPPAQP
jgi:thiol-disulfide isomerase/thioredoxin